MDKFGDSLPVIGQVKSGIESITAAIGELQGEQYSGSYFKKVMDEAKLQDKLALDRAKAAASARDFELDADRVLEQAKVAGLEGFAKKQEEINQEAFREQDALNKKMQQAREAAGAGSARVLELQRIVDPRASYTKEQKDKAQDELNTATQNIAKILEAEQKAEDAIYAKRKANLDALKREQVKAAEDENAERQRNMADAVKQLHRNTLQRLENEKSSIENSLGASKNRQLPHTENVRAPITVQSYGDKGMSKGEIEIVAQLKELNKLIAAAKAAASAGSGYSTDADDQSNPLY